MIFAFLALIIISGIVGAVAFLLGSRDKPISDPSLPRAEDFNIIESND